MQNFAGRLIQWAGAFVARYPRWNRRCRAFASDHITGRTGFFGPFDAKFGHRTKRINRQSGQDRPNAAHASHAWYYWPVTILITTASENPDMHSSVWMRTATPSADSKRPAAKIIDVNKAPYAGPFQYARFSSSDPFGPQRQLDLAAKPAAFGKYFVVMADNTLPKAGLIVHPVCPHRLIPTFQLQKDRTAPLRPMQHIASRG